MSARRTATRDFPASTLAAVDRRQGGRYCVLCREHKLVTPANEPLELDHMQPRSCGGTDHPSNLQWLCRAHNRSKSGKRAPSVAAAKVPSWSRRESLSRRENGST